MVDRRNMPLSVRVASAWQRIEALLEQYAPLSHQSLQPPASEDRIAAAENELGMAFPEELRTLLKFHNGVVEEPAQIDVDEEGEVWNTKFLDNHALLTLDQIVQQCWRLTDPVMSLSQPGYLPWLAPDPDDMTSCWLVSAREEDSGRLAKWSEYHALHFPTGPQTVAQLLEAHAEALESGTGSIFGAGENVPGVIYECLVWDDPNRPFLLGNEFWNPLR
ncbi:SMI1/KNR4 family protein [Streptomyces sp. NPDC057496]|uniref:SMI1/KNR4 family protein n=1 Tax=Streptomyces sp. NPDC057496 TaxID=3346149 RepID=UPI00367E4802